jgi:hypothetical protein
MATVNAPRGLVLARKNGSGSNSTGVTMIPMGGNYNSVAPSALLPSNIFTGDPITILGAGTITATSVAKTNLKSSGVFQGCSYVDSDGNQQFSRHWTGGATATDINLHICTDPAQTYFIQADASVTAAAGFGAGIWNGAWTAGAGSTKTGNSGYELAAATPVLTPAAGNMRVIRRAPWDTGAGGTAGTTDAFPWYEVRLNLHSDSYIGATVSATIAA